MYAGMLHDSNAPAPQDEFVAYQVVVGVKDPLAVDGYGL